jgi:signal transduction histidine kinase
MEAIGQLTGGVAHDFNNMLSVVMGAIELVSRRISNGDFAVQRFLDAATEATRRAAMLTQLFSPLPDSSRSPHSRSTPTR